MKCLGKSGLSRRDAGFYMARCSASRLSPRRPAFGPQPWLATGGAGPPPSPNNCRNLETRGTRPHTCRAVPPHPVIPADLDLRALARALATVVLAGAGALLGLWVLGDPGIAGVLTSTMKPNTARALPRSQPPCSCTCEGPGPGRALWLVSRSQSASVRCSSTAPGSTFTSISCSPVTRRRPRGHMPAAWRRTRRSGSPPGAGWRRRAAGWLALLVVFEAVLALLGYLHGTRSLYQVARALRLSQYTASGLLLLSVGTLVAWPQGTALEVLVRRTAGGLLSRRVLPPILTLPILLGFLRNAGERFGLYDAALGTALLTAAILLLAALLIFTNARVMDRLDVEQRRVAVENERLAAEARAAVATRDEFIALAGHELRTPITAMRLQAQLEERRTKRGAEELRRWTRLIDRLARLVETMLDTSRLAQRQLDLPPTTVDLALLVRGSVERLSALLAAAQASIRLQAEPGIVVRGDALRIEQAVENVLLNAAKYGAGRDIEVSVVREDAFARISICDEGIGIDPADHERIFARFERASRAENFGGLGLGLYLARQVVQAHGGTISVVSAPGKGATFHLRLPLAAGAEAAVGG